MSLKLKTYLKKLRKGANLLERTDIKGNVDNSFSAKYSVRLTGALISIIIILFLGKGFNDTFISYVSTILSIFIGLFINAIIFSFDKFHKRIEEKEPSSRKKLWDTISYNYSKQFSYITGYSIVLSIFTLSALSLNTIFPNYFNLNFHNYKIILENIKLENVINLIHIIIVFLQRFLIIFWIILIFYRTLFLVSSMVNFMDAKKNNEDD